jgi:DNA polymerase III delta prime subunit
MVGTPKPAYWLIGPPGSGKSHWVQERARKTGARILRIHARVDRSFRDGRPLLFSMHRSAENTIVWIEGADVLTPEAQAFLRRIIETCSNNVDFILETRDETRISAPIRSRCVTIYFGDQSYRRKHFNTIRNKLPVRVLQRIEKAEQAENVWLEEAKKDHIAAIIKAREESLNPVVLLQQVLNYLPVVRKDMFKKALGSGRSAWALLALACTEMA